VALVLGLGTIAQAQDDTTEPEGRIVRIGPADEAKPAPTIDEGRAPQTWPQNGGFGEPSMPVQSGYWIGVMAGPVSPALRAHLDIPAGQGVLVRDVLPDSPAAKAGLKQYDILLRANDIELRDRDDLVDLVRTAGEQKQQITLEVLRGAERETVWVTPAEQPEQPVMHGRPFGSRGDGDAVVPGTPNDLFGWFGDRFDGRNGGPFAFRRLGPGAVVGGRALGFAEIPNGVSVSIQKQNDQPAQITVRRGDETWEIVGDDPQSLEQLPDDVRPFVEQLLGQTEHDGFHDFTMPVVPDVHQMQQFGQHEAQLQQQLQAMEQRMRELEQRLLGHPADAEPADTQ